MAPAKRWPLPKRFSVAMTEEAYDKLRTLNGRFGYSNNYLLTVLLENLDEICDDKALEEVFDRVKAEFGAPKPGRADSANKMGG